MHNERVVEQIDAAGVRVIDSLDEADPGILMIRAHGATPSLYERAQETGLEIVDATCPLVHEIHQKVRMLHDEGYPIVIIGDHDHDEVRGIAAQAPGTVVVSTPDEVEHALEKSRYRKIGVVCQSTQNVDNVKAIICELVPRAMELKFFNTICFPTTKHQEEIRTMPLENDVMVVVGSFTSANTKRMTEISKALNPRSYQVTGAADLDAEWFRDARTVGVHAGASTPDFVVDEVVSAIGDIARESGDMATVDVKEQDQ